MPQNYKNHSQLIPAYHFIILPFIIFCVGASIWNLNFALHIHHGRLQAAMFFLIADVLLAMFFFSRGFALKAQDRAIRAEENLRHFSMTGKLLDKKLKTGQIIALRFAPDEEFVSLAQKAANENMKPKEIKEAIQNWKADHYRV